MCFDDGLYRNEWTDFYVGDEVAVSPEDYDPGESSTSTCAS